MPDIDPRSTYTEEAAETILSRLSEGETLVAICADLNMSRRTVGKWRKANPEFDAAYKIAQEDSASALIEEVIGIVDDREGDKDAASRKVRAWARLEIAKRKAPHLYGDKVAMEHSGPGGGPVETVARIERRIVRPE